MDTRRLVRSSLALPQQYIWQTAAPACWCRRNTGTMGQCSCGSAPLQLVQPAIPMLGDPGDQRSSNLLSLRLASATSLCEGGEEPGAQGLVLRHAGRGGGAPEWGARALPSRAWK